MSDSLLQKIAKRLRPYDAELIQEHQAAIAQTATESTARVNRYKDVLDAINTSYVTVTGTDLPNRPEQFIPALQQFATYAKRGKQIVDLETSIVQAVQLYTTEFNTRFAALKEGTIEGGLFTKSTELFERAYISIQNADLPTSRTATPLEHLRNAASEHAAKVTDAVVNAPHSEKTIPSIAAASKYLHGIEITWLDVSMHHTAIMQHAQEHVYFATSEKVMLLSLVQDIPSEKRQKHRGYCTAAHKSIMEELERAELAIGATLTDVRAEFEQYDPSKNI